MTTPRRECDCCPMTSARTTPAGVDFCPTHDKCVECGEDADDVDAKREGACGDFEGNFVEWQPVCSIPACVKFREQDAAGERAEAASDWQDCRMLIGRAP